MHLKGKEQISAQRWFSCPKPIPVARLRLFCFPYGGGGSAIYNSWPKGLPTSIEVQSVQLPGHGQRFSEPLITYMPTMVEMLTQAILPRLDVPYAFFGHSMGAIICFELARQLRRSHNSEPAYLFVSGHRAPQIPKTTPLVHDLPDPEFITELKKLGTSKDLLNSAELLAMLLPVIRADYKMIESYSYTEDPPFKCPIMAFGGERDYGVPCEHLEAWKEQTVTEFKLRMLSGDHFFIHSEEPALLTMISTELNRYC